MNISEELIRTIVREILEASNKNGGDFEKQVDPSGVIGVKTSTVRLEPFEGRQDVFLRDVTNVDEAPRIGAGVMELTDAASFEWTLTYDEVDVVLEGTLEIVIDGRVVRGGPGDIIYIPKNTHIFFRTPDRTKYAYVVYPANWSEV